MLHAPGKVEFKASKKELTGAVSGRFMLPDLPRSKLYAGRFKLLDKQNKTPIGAQLYRKYRADGSVIYNRSDEHGHTQKTTTVEVEALKIMIETHEKFHRSKIDEDEINDWFNGEIE